MSLSRQQIIDRLMRGVGEDVRDYRALIAVLEEQFSIAIRHDAAELQVLNERIDALVHRLEGRCVERVTMVHAMHGKGARMSTVIAALPPTRQKLLETGWSSLEALVHRCKELNLRNCRLMTDQHDVMRRVMHGEGETYAPA